MTHAISAAAMSTQDINNLRDDQFAYIEPGGTKDSSGRTVPRSLRHFPIHDAAHVRNALARIAQGAQFGDQAMPAIRRAAKKFGITVAAAAPANEYGPASKVDFADPGYQPDGKHRYPLDTEAHCRAAWAFVNMPKNAAKYSSQQLAEIKDKIMAAGKKYGITFADHMMAAAMSSQILGVELARPGEWHLSGGKRTFSEADLQDAADFFAASGQSRIPIGFGHRDQRFDGDPAFGWVSNIRLAKDGKGPVLLGDLVDMEDWVAAAAPSRWPNRSIEGFANLDWNGRTYSLALTRLALLGATPPAMPTLRSLSDLREAIAAAAEDSGAELIAASGLDEVEDEPEAQPYESAELSEEDIQDPAAEAVVPTSSTKEAGMDPAKIRERLGLDDDVSDDEVMEALAYAGFVPQADTSAEPVAASAAPSPDLLAKPGMVHIDASAWNEREERIRKLEAQEARRRNEERDQVIAEAVRQGKFTPARREHWVRLWNADPEGTRSVMDTLARNVIPVAASGYSVEDDETFDAEFAHLFPPTARKGA